MWSAIMRGDTRIPSESSSCSSLTAHHKNVSEPRHIQADSTWIFNHPMACSCCFQTLQAKQRQAASLIPYNSKRSLVTTQQALQL